MIEFKEVTKEYSKGIAALNGVNLKIEKGELHLLSVTVVPGNLH